MGQEDERLKEPRRLIMDLAKTCGLSWDEVVKLHKPGMDGAQWGEAILAASKHPEHKASTSFCPRCSSPSTQSIKMVCLLGTQTSTSVGVGLSDSGSIGVGVMDTESVSALAQRLIPGGPPQSILGGIGAGFLLGGIVLVFLALFVGPVLLVFAIPSIVVGWPLLNRGKKEVNAQRPAWLAKLRMYQNGWICLQCGSTWIP